MQFEEYKNLWVFVETEENAAKSVGYELLSPGRTLADKMGGKLVAVVAKHIRVVAGILDNAAGRKFFLHNGKA